MKFRKKPVVVDAVQWGGFNKQIVIKEVRHYAPYRVDKKCEHCGASLGEHGWIKTLEGGHIVCPNDWIITGVQGEKYPCKPDIFKLTYEPVEIER